jgi:hypothetical protein
MTSFHPTMLLLLTKKTKKARIFTTFFYKLLFYGPSYGSTTLRQSKIDIHKKDKNKAYDVRITDAIRLYITRKQGC